MNKQFLNLLGLAYRANKILLGEDSIIKDLQSKKVKLLIIAHDASSNTRKKLTDKCKSYSTPYKIVGTRDELSHAIGKQNRVAFAILDEGFANKLLQLISD
ncbi:YlxQ family RNA-binding protein [Bacillaceae bacterium W0354]